MEMAVDLHEQPEPGAAGRQFRQADMAQFRRAEPGVAKPERAVGFVGIDLGKQPGA